MVVNLQGDLPTIPRAQLRAVLTPLADPAVRYRHAGRADRSEEEANTASFVKAACAFDRGRRASRRRCISRASRSPGATGRAGTTSASTPIRRAALARYVALPPSPLEQRENLEQLRALEAGMRIACARMEHGPFGVDTPEDLERARAGCWRRPAHA